MKIEEIMAHVDHTVLSVDCTEKEICALLDDAVRFGTASVCIPPAYVRFAKEYAGRRMKICTVIGFPNGYEKTEVKVFETHMAVMDGADEIDMVIWVGLVKDGKWDEVKREICAVRAACPSKILKVIVETCLLTEEEKIRLCHIVHEAGADYIKTSTGFSRGGATFEDVALMAKHCPAPLRIKAAGGISSLADAERFLALGADRLGTSRIVKIAKEKEQGGSHEESNPSY